MIFLLACTRPDAGSPPPSVVGALTRASIDVRGVRPSEAEIALVERDPSALAGLLDAFVADPRWEGRVREQYQRILRTRSESYLVFEREVLADPRAFVSSVGEEPLRLVGQIAALDEPYTALLTADWTVVDEQLAAEYRTDYPDGATGWQIAHYLDGRPAAGVLSTNGMWWRYPSTASNANRKRANQISRVFTCDDFLDAEIPFDPSIDLLDEAAIANAIATNPSCTACHRDLDPIASNLYGFWFFYDDGLHLADASVYHPEEEHRWRDQTGVAPGWFGVPTTGLATLPAQIIADDRFVPCAVENTWHGLTGTTGEAPDIHTRAFADGGYTLRSLWRSVLDDPGYRGAPPKLTTPDLVADMVEDLTGYRWEVHGVDAMTTELTGMLTLAGGADGVTVTEPLTTPSTTAALVMDRLAELAASHVVGQEVGAAERELFTAVDPGSADRVAAVAQLQALHLRVTSRRVAADGPEVAANLALWDEVYAMDGRADHAWTAVLAAMLRSPEFSTY